MTRDERHAHQRRVLANIVGLLIITPLLVFVCVAIILAFFGVDILG